MSNLICAMTNSAYPRYPKLLLAAEFYARGTAADCHRTTVGRIQRRLAILSTSEKLTKTFVEIIKILAFK